MKKWWLNYWYHYKLRTILGVFFAIIIGVTVWQLATRVNYDYKVYLYLSDGVTSDVEHAVELTFEDYGEDLNDDGKVKVQIINLSYNPYDTIGDNQMSYASALTGEIRNCENFIYLTDNYRFEELDDQSLFGTYSFLGDKNGKAMSTKGTNFEKLLQDNFKKQNLSPNKVPEMYLNLRVEPDKSARHYDNYKRDLKMVKEIVAKEK